MPDVVNDVATRIDGAAIVDILVVSAAIYWLLLLVHHTTAMTVLRGAAVLLITAFALSQLFELRMLNWILRNSLAGLVIGALVVFNPEIRRALERLGRTGLPPALRRREYRDTIDVVVRTVTDLGRQRVGALIVLERETGLQDVIDTGVPVDATLSMALLESIFHTSSPLHDGAVVIRRDRVIAAGCTLRLSDAPLPAGFGMRHRAALGVVEQSDAVAVVVSEERGTISLASNGRMAPSLDGRRLTSSLLRLFGVDEESVGSGSRPVPLHGRRADGERP